jgi:DNA ligase D-like protein (predicted 3'-phosphoesterase)
MPLDEYKRKRDFSSSPEPSGRVNRDSPAGRTPRFFCVQKHLASHLHYDFRLEHNGVLLSWAVPKGPSLDPSTKRLAMHVEDHPVEYGEFEGVIPSGYGAGIVMLWDHGTWVPEVDDVDAALRKGDLKLTLDGFKLKGSWALVRTKGRWSGGGDASRSWLLIKHRDEWAGPVDIAEFAPLSVKSRGDFADILAQEHPDVWESHRPAQAGEAGRMFARIVERALEMRTSKVPETAQAAGAASPGDRSRVRSAGGTAASDRNSSTRKTASRPSQSRTRAAAAAGTKKRKAASPRATGPARKTTGQARKK